MARVDIVAPTARLTLSNFARSLPPASTVPTTRFILLPYDVMSHAASSFLHRISTFASLQAVCMFAVALPRPVHRFSKREEADAEIAPGAVLSVDEFACVGSHATLTTTGVVCARESDLRPSSVRARRTFGASF